MFRFVVLLIPPPLRSAPPAARKCDCPLARQGEIKSGNCGEVRTEEEEEEDSNRGEN